MVWLSSGLAAVLSIIAVLHFLWGLKVWVPVPDEMRLARSVVGARNIEKMPPAPACFFVAAALFGFAVLAFVLAGVISIPFIPAFLIQAAAVIAVMIFISRGLIGYTEVFARATPEQPFRTYDRLYYSPLCLMLGAGFGILV